MSSAKKFVLTSLAILLLAGCGPTRQDKGDFDILITGGLVVDGSGAPGVRADVGIREGTIAAVGDLGKAEAHRVIDATGLVVAPGIIDIHSHSDYSLLVDGNAESKIRQGVTTEILGEATSAGPLPLDSNEEPRQESAIYGVKFNWQTLGEYLERLQASGISVNAGSYVGSMTVRRCVMGETNRKATQDEIEQMAELVEQAMREGALGVATALLGSPLSTE